MKERPTKIAGVDLRAFNERFPDEKSAFDYFISKVHPSGPRCRHCGCDKVAQAHKSGPRSVKGSYYCKSCKEWTGCMYGTPMYRSSIPLLKWLTIAYVLSCAKRPFGSDIVAKALGITLHTADKIMNAVRTSSLADEGLQDGMEFLPAPIRPGQDSDKVDNSALLTPEYIDILSDAVRQKYRGERRPIRTEALEAIDAALTCVNLGAFLTAMFFDSKPGMIAFGAAMVLRCSIDIVVSLYRYVKTRKRAAT